MAKKITTNWDIENNEWAYSERNYDQVEVRVEVIGSYGDNRLIDQTLYIDFETGLVTANVGRFEEWLKANRIDREGE